MNLQRFSMNRYLKIGLLVLAGAAIADGIRYLQPESKNKKIVQLTPPPSKNITGIVLVYNAWGGLYPGLIDFFHKELFPKSYPCNLCYQTFGTFSMKEAWRQYLGSLPYQITELHKDNFKRQYTPENLPLPCVLATDSEKTWLLLSAEEINSIQSMESLKQAMQGKLN